MVGKRKAVAGWPREESIKVRKYGFAFEGKTVVIG
jgi:hypothetical protein